VGFTGREPDEMGLIYYRARYYDPAVGRFTQRDPIGLQGGINQYAYVNNNPINYTDPLGLMAAGPSGSNASAYPAPDTSMIVACALCTGLGMLPPPPVGGYQGLTPKKPADGSDALFGTQTSTPPSVGQQLGNAIGGFVNGAIDGATNLGNLIFNQGKTPSAQTPPIGGDWAVAPNPQVPGGIIATPPGATPGDTSGEHIRVYPPNTSSGTKYPDLQGGYWRWFRPDQGAGQQSGYYDPVKGTFGGGKPETHVPTPPGYQIPSPN
jgi:RHS repeat-associated protein